MTQPDKCQTQIIIKKKLINVIKVILYNRNFT